LRERVERPGAQRREIVERIVAVAGALGAVKIARASHRASGRPQQLALRKGGRSRVEGRGQWTSLVVNPSRLEKPTPTPAASLSATTGPDAVARRSPALKLPKGATMLPVHAVRDGRALAMFDHPTEGVCARTTRSAARARNSI